MGSEPKHDEPTDESGGPLIPHHRLCGLAIGHGIAAWAFHLERYTSLTDHPLTARYAGASLFIALAGLVVLLWGIAGVWGLCKGTLRKLFRVEEKATSKTTCQHAQQHLILTVLMITGTATGVAVFPAVDLFTFVIGGLLSLSFAVAGTILILVHHRAPSRGWLALDDHWPTARLIPLMAVSTWGILTLLELMALRTAGNFFNFVDITAVVHVMFDEALTMFFGPGAVWFLTAILLFCLGTTSLTLVNQRIQRRAQGHRVRRWATWTPIGILIIGAASLLDLSPRDRLLALWYVHPQVASMTRLLTSAPTHSGADKQAALALYPDRVSQPTPAYPDAVSASAYAEKARGTASNQNVLLVFIDTLSRRHVETYGHARPVAPNLDALAQESLIFDHARSNGGHTDLATIALFYSLIPYLAESKAKAYSTGHGGMPFHLVARAAGLKVGLFSGDWEIWNEGQSPVFPGQCDAFLDARLEQNGPHGEEVSAWAGVPEHRVVDAFTTWYPRVLAKGQRFLGYVKLFRTHLPYYTPEAETIGGSTWSRPFHPQAQSIGLTDYRPSGARAALVETRYDNAIHYADHHLGRLIAHLKSTGAWANTSIVLIADHGEAWGEHGWYSHGHQHFEEFLEVPLLIRRPGHAPGRDQRPVSTIDVAPTILDLLGLPTYTAYQGQSLLKNNQKSTEYWAFSNTLSRLATLQIGPWKYTQDRVTGQTWLHDLGADPAERQNLAWRDEYRDRRRALKYLLYTGLERQVRYADHLLKTPTTQLIKTLPPP